MQEKVWIQRNSGIKKASPVITLNTTLILTNAIYFKGEWLTQFEKENTTDDDFYISPDKTIKAPMMRLMSNLKFEKFSGFSAVELPYEGNDLAMIILLPEEVGGLAKLERNLTNDNEKKWINKLAGSHKSEIFVNLPKFKSSSEFELSKILTGMGMPSAFSLSSADFSGMTGRKNIFINKLIHKDFLDVNEEGTEAAVVTAARTDLITAKRPQTFLADHPFVFLIHDRQTGSILFIGRIIDPTK